MTRKLFVHVGPGKTGTSAIQGYFRDHETTTVLYPESGRWPDGAHHKLVFAFEGKSLHGQIGIPPWKDLSRQLDEEVAGSTKNVLISSEISTHEFVKALQTLLARHRLNASLIITFRPPLERAASSYNQGVKDSIVGLREDPDAYLLNETDRFLFRPFFEGWYSLGLPVTVLPYRDDLPLVQRFGQAIGLDLPAEVGGTRRNRSMGGSALLTILLANKLMQSEQERRSFFELIRQDDSFRIWKGDTFPFSTEACEKFYGLLEDEFQWLSETFGFARSGLCDAARPRFELSGQDVQQIHRQLQKAGLFEGNERLIEDTIAPFRSA